jgi:hypothetical protein
MGLRAFRDSNSIEWRVWDVRPVGSTALERRMRDRRNPDPVIRYSGPERRTGRERRLTNTTRWVIPIREWLAFDCEGEKRRLVPVPEGWEELPDQELERLCDQAVRVQKKLPE